MIFRVESSVFAVLRLSRSPDTPKVPGVRAREEKRVFFFRCRIVSGILLLNYSVEWPFVYRCPWCVSLVKRSLFCLSSLRFKPRRMQSRKQRIYCCKNFLWGFSSSWTLLSSVKLPCAPLSERWSRSTHSNLNHSLVTKSLRVIYSKLCILNVSKGAHPGDADDWSPGN